MTATMPNAFCGFSASKIKIELPKNNKNTITKKGVNINERMNINATINPTSITHGDMPLLYNKIKKERNTKEEPKSGCSNISRAGPKKRANEMAKTFVLVTLVLKKLR